MEEQKEQEFSAVSLESPRDNSSDTEAALAPASPRDKNAPDFDTDTESTPQAVSLTKRPKPEQSAFSLRGLSSDSKAPPGSPHSVPKTSELRRMFGVGGRRSTSYSIIALTQYEKAHEEIKFSPLLSSRTPRRKFPTDLSREDIGSLESVDLGSSGGSSDKAPLLPADQNHQSNQNSATSSAPPFQQPVPVEPLMTWQERADVLAKWGELGAFMALDMLDRLLGITVGVALGLLYGGFAHPLHVFSRIHAHNKKIWASDKHAVVKFFEILFKTLTCLIMFPDDIAVGIIWGVASGVVYGSKGLVKGHVLEMPEYLMNTKCHVIDGTKEGRDVLGTYTHKLNDNGEIKRVLGVEPETDTTSKAYRDQGVYDYRFDALTGFFPSQENPHAYYFDGMSVALTPLVMGLTIGAFAVMFIVYSPPANPVLLGFMNLFVNAANLVTISGVVSAKLAGITFAFYSIFTISTLYSSYFALKGFSWFLKEFGRILSHLFLGIKEWHNDEKFESTPKESELRKKAGYGMFEDEKNRREGKLIPPAALENGPDLSESAPSRLRSGSGQEVELLRCDSESLTDSGSELSDDESSSSAVELSEQEGQPSTFSGPLKASHSASHPLSGSGSSKASFKRSQGHGRANSESPITSRHVGNRYDAFGVQKNPHSFTGDETFMVESAAATPRSSADQHLGSKVKRQRKGSVIVSRVKQSSHSVASVATTPATSPASPADSTPAPGGVTPN